MKKFLAFLLAASMVLTLTSCLSEDDDDSKKSKKGNSSSQESKEDSSKDDDSKDDDSKDDDSKDDDSKDDESKDDDSKPASAGMQKITYKSLTMEIPDTWTTETTGEATFYYPLDMDETGNNLNFTSSVAMESLSILTKDSIESTMTSIYPEYKVSIPKFEHTTINGYEAIEMTYNFSILGMEIVTNQFYINGDDYTYIITFTGNTGDFADISGIVNSISLD